MTSKELRQAAERYRKHAQVSLYMKDMKESPYTYIEVSTGAVGIVNEAWDNDAHRLANAYLATVQEDGEEIPDENYLSKEWPRLGGSFDDSEAGYLHLEHDSLLGSLYFYLGKLRYAISVGNSIPITTRSQFRSLMTGLGIEPQKISEKR